MTGQTQRPAGRAAGLRARYGPSLSLLRESGTAKAAGLAAAMIANNVVALAATFVFARLLDDYGALGALVSYLLILAVAGQALQVATAREGVLGHLGVGNDLLATVRRWTRTLLIATVALTAVSIALQHPIAAAVGVKRYSWAAAAGIPAACIWLELSLLRGALQAVGDYKGVGISLVAEQTVRLLAGAVLAAIGLGVTGAYLGSLLSFVAMALYCWQRLCSDVRPAPGPGLGALGPRLWSHIRGAAVPIAGLSVIALLQNIDLIVAKHRFVRDVASAYAATAVAAKVLIWVAIGAGFYLVPEVSRRRAAGEDPRPVLLRALAIVGVCALPCLAIYAGVPHLLLTLAFGAKRATVSRSLLVLGGAFTMLAVTYLAVQYMLALKQRWFLIPLAVVAVAEPFVLAQAPRHPTGFAGVVLGVQALGAVVAFGLALRRVEATAPVAPVPSVRPDGGSRPDGRSRPEPA